MKTCILTIFILLLSVGGNLLSDVVVSEINGIKDSRHLLTDSMLLGEDVLEDLKIIDQRVTRLEQKIDA